MSAWIKTAVQPRLTFPTLTGSIVTFNSQYALPLKSHTVDIDSVSGVSEIIIGNCDSDIAYLWTVDSSFKGDVLFNQIYNYTSGSTTGLGVVRTISSGLISFSGESTSAGNSVTFAWTDFTVPNGHKVIVLKDFTLPEGDYIFDQYNGYRNVDITNTIMNVSAGYIIPQLRVSAAGHDYTGISGHLSVIDLTVMFGSTIADYIYNLEQGEAGAGVAFFKSMYPDNYYPYNAGTKQGVGNSTTISIGSTVNEATYNARTGILEVTQPSVQTIQLPPCPIDTLEGVNNIWADTGDTTLQYPKFG